MKGIPLYNNINDLHQLTGSLLRTANPLFHCFDMALANNITQPEQPPHRAGFYTLALNFGTEKLDYVLNDQPFQHPRNFVLCVAPGQVATWTKRGNWFGFCTFFKSEFLLVNGAVNFLRQYPFFSSNETNLLPVGPDDFATLTTYFRQILVEQQADSPFGQEIIRSLFQAVLWQVRRLYEAEKANTPSVRASSMITAQFQYLVNEHFISKTSVGEYAQLLNITPNHLSQTIKATTGRTASSIIAQRRLEEARYLLAYTDNDVADIADHLRFFEPTHFTKFFRKATGLTPVAFRAKQVFHHQPMG